MKTVTPATFGRVLFYSASAAVVLGIAALGFPGYSAALQLGGAMIITAIVGWAVVVPLNRTAP